MIYPHSNQYTNCYTELHQLCRFRCVSINVLAFSAVLPYYVWEHRCILVPINTAMATASHVINVPPVSEHTVKIWKTSAIRCLKYLVHPHSFMWTYHEHLGNVYYPESRTVLFTFTAVYIPWSCSGGMTPTVQIFERKLLLNSAGADQLA